MASVPAPLVEPARRTAALTLVAVGSLAFTGSLALGAGSLAGGAVAFATACALALREARTATVTWTAAVGGLITVIWLIPIRSYTLPISLPFQLEPYRLLLLVLVAGWLVGALRGRASLRAGGHGWPLALLGGSAVCSLIANLGTVHDSGGATQAVKTLSYFLSALVIFVLICSIVRTRADARRLLAVCVAGATIVAAGAMYESRTHVDVFDRIHTAVPVLHYIGNGNQAVRKGRLRVRASAQHPIALGVALVMCCPLALFLASASRRRYGRAAWLLSTALLAAGAVSTQSRTVVLALVAMLITAFLLRGRSLLRHWPIALVALVAVHGAAPGAIGGLWNAFNPKGGLVGEQDKRSGTTGSGRVSDFGPGIAMGLHHPFLGRGLGTGAIGGASAAAANVKPGAVGGGQGSDVPGAGAGGGDASASATAASASSDPAAVSAEATIFDDQYLRTLVSLGVIGFIAVLWTVWGAVVRLGRAARRETGEAAALAAACAVSCAGFAIAMATFDAFSFVQVMLVFFVVAALGLRHAELAEAPA